MRLNETSAEPGLYALYDHENQAAYIGITGNFRHRIFNNHSSGDGNSHKFSTVYNAGRMFHARKDPRTCASDGKIAKSLRTLFVRSHCRAVTYPMSAFTKSQLEPIEAAILGMAPPEATRWNNVKALDAFEPCKLLDAFLDTLGWDASRLAAIERQAYCWSSPM